MTTQIATDTELSAVNSILGSIGQSPVTAINFVNPELKFIYNIFEEVTKDVCNEGWHFNTEEHVKKEPLTVAPLKFIPIENNALRYDVSDGQHLRTQDVIRKYYNNVAYLYDKNKASRIDTTNAGFEFDEHVHLDIVYLRSFVEIPPVFQRYIIAKASSRAAAQLVANPQLVQLLEKQEASTRASVMEYECQHGDPSYLGWPAGRSYGSYQPYRALIR